MFENFVLLEAAPVEGQESAPVEGQVVNPTGSPAPGTDGSTRDPFESMLPFLLIMALMIFFMWFSGRKQRKRAKMMQERKNNLKNGDRVMMDCGIYGVVKNIEDDIVTIAVGPKEVELVFNKAAISIVEYDEDKVDLSREQAKDMEKK